MTTFAQSFKAVGEWFAAEPSESGGQWSRIWRDFRITVLFLVLAAAAGALLLLFETSIHRPTALLWALACGAAGGTIGFLFGIPRVLQDSSTHPPRPSDDQPSPTHGAASDEYRIQVNTNLEQISDWLTKIIVGVGLVELKSLPAAITELSHFVSQGLGATPHTQALAMALIAYFGVLGFLGGYLMTRIYLAQAFSRADWGTRNTVSIAGSRLTIAEVDQQQRKLFADLQEQVVLLQKSADTALLPTQRPALRAEAPVSQPVSRILWVDDSPHNNSILVEQLQQRGIQVTQVTSTTDALARLAKNPTDRIITDMGRREGPVYNVTAGIDLIRAIRADNRVTPIIVFCSKEAEAKYGTQAEAAGATAVTSSSTLLLKELNIQA